MARIQLSSHSPLREIILAAYPDDDEAAGAGVGTGKLAEPGVDWGVNGRVVAFTLWSADDIESDGLEAQVTRVQQRVRELDTDDEGSDDDSDDQRNGKVENSRSRGVRRRTAVAAAQ
jgi:hypothetical protein